MLREVVRNNSEPEVVRRLGRDPNPSLQFSDSGRASSTYCSRRDKSCRAHGRYQRGPVKPPLSTAPRRKDSSYGSRAPMADFGAGLTGHDPHVCGIGLAVCDSPHCPPLGVSSGRACGSPAFSFGLVWVFRRALGMATATRLPGGCRRQPPASPVVQQVVW